MTVYSPQADTTTSLYQPETLIGVVSSLILPAQFLLSMAFNDSVYFETEEIQVDVEIGGNTIAAFCSPEVEGKVIRERGFITKTFKPPYIKEKVALSTKKAFKRILGENIYAGGAVLTPMQRQMLRIQDSYKLLGGRVKTRKEVMAAEALVHGTVTVVGTDYPLDVIDFQRDPSLTTALAGNAAWDQQATANPIADIETFSNLVLETGGGVITTLVMGARAWLNCWSNPGFQRALHIGPNATGLQVALGPNANMSKVAYKGGIGNVGIYVYQDFYLADDGTRVPYIPSNTIVGFGSEIEGRQLHGAIQDEEAGLMALEAFPSTWIERDPSKRMCMLQSAPLVAPWRPNNSFSAQVCA